MFLGICLEPLQTLSSVSQQSSAEGEGLTIDRVRRSGLKPQQVTEILGRPGGRRQFFDMMREAEKGAGQ